MDLAGPRVSPSGLGFLPCYSRLDLLARGKPAMELGGF